MPSAAAAQSLAILGAVFWSCQLLPQIYLNHRRQSTQGLSVIMMMLWSLAGVILGIYNISADLSVALWVQAQILTALSLACVLQCLYYDHHKSRQFCVLTGTIACIVFAGIETAGILGLRQVNDSVKWPLHLFAVLAAVLLAIGVARELWNIVREGSIEGFSVVFALLDAMGDLTSLLSLFFMDHLDVYAVVIYGSELALWIVFIITYVIIWRKTRDKQDTSIRRDKVKDGAIGLQRVATHEKALWSK